MLIFLIYKQNKRTMIFVRNHVSTGILEELSERSSAVKVLQGLLSFLTSARPDSCLSSAHCQTGTITLPTAKKLQL